MTSRGEICPLIRACDYGLCDPSPMIMRTISIAQIYGGVWINLLDRKVGGQM